MSFIEKLTASLDNHNKGYSARKLSSFVIITLIVAAHLSWLNGALLENDFSLLSEVLIIDYGFIAALLGMTTYQGVKKDKKEDEPGA
jgi:hypothetical protein